MKSLLFILTLVLALTSCKSKKVQECFQPTSVSVQLGFQVIDSFIVVDSFNRPIQKVAIRDTNLYFPTLKSIGQDSNIVFQGEQSVNRMSLFLNPDSSQIKYIFQPNRDSIAQFDTLTIKYSSEVHFLNNACGYTYFYTINSVEHTKKVVDSTLNLNPVVSTAAQSKNLIIYFID